MYINRNVTGFIKAEVYPFIDTKDNASYSDLIRVNSDGKVIWRHESWTEQEALEYIGRLSVAFAAAFKIAKGGAE